MSFTPSMRQEAEAIFAARKDKPKFIDYEFKDYGGSRSYSSIYIVDES